ncbi:MAG: Txe/YoeB family addiction module toxin [Myxococcota bacterium]
MKRPRTLVFESDSWAEWQTLQRQSPKLAQKAVLIIKEMRREDPSVGIGRPEPLRYQLSGLWSRRLSSKDRIIYSFDEDTLTIWAIGGHYRDK